MESRIHKMCWRPINIFQFCWHTFIILGSSTATHVVIFEKENILILKEITLKMDTWVAEKADDHAAIKVHQYIWSAFASL